MDGISPHVVSLRIHTLIGGPCHGESMPVPQARSVVQVARLGGVREGGFHAEYTALPPTSSYQFDHYTRCRVFMGRTREAVFYAHESLTGDEACERFWDHLMDLAEAS